MHGPTFMGNAAACAAANASLDLFETQPRLEQVSAIETQLRERLEPLNDFDHVVDVRCLGAIGVVQLDRPIDVDSAIRFFVDRGVWIRPLRDVIYLAPSFTIGQQDLFALCDSIHALVQSMVPTSPACVAQASSASNV
jgi:adenosylmethionine-8-amino-7-oxononanoate aminotransferase